MNHGALKHVRQGAWLAVVLALSASATVLAQMTMDASGDERVIQITAQRFKYTPDSIVLKKGQAVRLEFTALDFEHGFKIPDLDIRADLTPDHVVAVRLIPQRVGVFDFLCDNFCGSNHEDMDGHIRVEE